MTGRERCWLGDHDPLSKPRLVKEVIQGGGQISKLIGVERPVGEVTVFHAFHETCMYAQWSEQLSKQSKHEAQTWELRNVQIAPVLATGQAYRILQILEPI
jgi:hypothetical protein